MALSNITAFNDGRFALQTLVHPRGGHELAVVLGLIILVQGLETPRFLGSSYDAATRIRTMRWAQWLSTGIYLTFILLLTPFFRGGLPKQGGETAFIGLLSPIGGAVGPQA